MVSYDVEKMYNNITRDMGIQAAQKFWESRTANPSCDWGKNLDPDISTDSLLEGLSLCLDSNYFEYEGKIYKQIGGVGTGVKLAPPYACLAMGDFEEEAFKKIGDDEGELLNFILLWKRFIDDIFLLFKGSRAECDRLTDKLNNVMPGIIKLKCNFSDSDLEFLDLRIKIVGGRLETEIYVKPTNLQLFLDYTSNHPQHCKDSIVYSQALRVVERCSQPDSAVPHLETLREKFIDRNYPSVLVESQIGKAKSKDRKSIIFQQRKKKNEGDDRIRLIFTHNAQNPPIHKWLRTSKKCLNTPKGKELGSRMQIVTRQPRNLKTMVSGAKKKQARTEPEGEAGCFKCTKCKVACPVLKESKVFQSNNTKKTYPIRQHMTCTSSFVIYLATCRRCRGQYVGKSQTDFRRRHSNHKQEIRWSKGGLGQHFGGARACSYQDLSIQLIEHVEQGNKSLLCKREQYWQNQLRVFVENGSNGMVIRKDYE